MHHENFLDKGAAIGLPKVNPNAFLRTATGIQRKFAAKIDLTTGAMSPKAIRAIIRLEDVNLRNLAELNGFTDPWIHQVINGQYPDLRVRRIIADAIKMPYEEVWGEVVNAS